MAEMTVLSLDDHEVVSTGLQGVLNRGEGVNLIGSTTEASKLFPMVTQLEPDVVLLDVYLGEDPTWQTCKQIADIAQGPAVIIYSSYGNAQLLDRAMAAGASGYVLKATPASALVPIIRRVGQGECHWEPSIYDLWRRGRARRQSALLPKREMQIISFIAQGMDNFEIAEQLNISHHTVKFHISKALKRTGETTRAGLVRIAMAEHIIN